MATVLIVAYLLIVVALIAVILLQRSEGGGLGMGSSSNSLISVRGSANLLTRTTAVLATLFFVLAIALTLMAELDRGTDNILDKVNQAGEQPATVLDALKQMQDASAPATDAAPATTTPATTAPAATDQAASATSETPAAPAAEATPAAEAAPAAAPAATAPADATQPAAPSN